MKEHPRVQFSFAEHLSSHFPYKELCWLVFIINVIQPKVNWKQSRNEVGLHVWRIVLIG